MILAKIENICVYRYIIVYIYNYNINEIAFKVLFINALRKFAHFSVLEIYSIIY